MTVRGLFVLDAVTVVEDEVCELVRRRGMDQVVDGAAIRRLVEDVVADYEERTLTSALPAITDTQACAVRFDRHRTRRGGAVHLHPPNSRAKRLSPRYTTSERSRSWPSEQDLAWSNGHR